MSGPLGSSQLMYSTGAGNFYEHLIERSCRFDNGDSSRLYRDFGTPSDATKFTVSFWLKIPRFFGYTQLFSRAGGYTGGGAAIVLEDDMGSGYENVISMYGMTGDGGGNAGANNMPANELRDDASWYHIHWKADTSKSGMSGNNAKIVNHINGVLSVFAYSNEPTGNFNRFNDNGQTHSIGNGSSGTQGDSLLAEFIFLDGQYEDYTTFGEFKNGVWIPKDTTGVTFGNNGFHLKFEDSSDLGNDSSGNNNDFTATGLGTDHQSLDSPTFGS